mmetsp:Transcript_6816/g.21457  ORF Transcript_6816/g.21457 Transcript_6816/m.21457 type:complete len:632 (-) Transcript_6816:94-1989(-)
MLFLRTAAKRLAAPLLMQARRASSAPAGAYVECVSKSLIWSSIAADVPDETALAADAAKVCAWLGLEASAPDALDAVSATRVYDLYLPIYYWVKGVAARTTRPGPCVVFVSAPQGCGKTTICEAMVELFESEGKTAVALSYDDFYLTHPEQLEVASSGDRLLEFRGSAGTHDVALGTRVLASLAATGGTPYALRKKFAAAAFAHSARYDAAIAAWFAGQLGDDAGAAPALLTRACERARPLKYGNNPHQKPAALYRPLGAKEPFTVRNGSPGYINMLDAFNAYQLVRELRAALDLPAAASFKHVSPAGAGLGVPLTPLEARAYEVADAAALTPLATAYVRARQADPLCSFGDFVALSDVVDAATALVLKREVSDGVVAPGFDADALEILAAKKGGKFVCVEVDPAYAPPPLEYREVYGVGFAQARNARECTKADVAVDAVSGGPMPGDAQRDLVLASITAKYTQSNSICFAVGGQVVGVGAGQQSRVDCVKLAAKKVATWWLRQTPPVLDLPFAEGLKRQQRVNARVAFLEGGFDAYAPQEKAAFDKLFASGKAPPELGASDRAALMKKLDGVALASDAFFPFPDNIDVAAKFGVKFIAQAGGSVQDPQVLACAKGHGMMMAMTGVRLFHH